MKIRAVVQGEMEFDIKHFHSLCEETFDENSDLKFVDLVEKCFQKILYATIQDYGYSIVSINEDDKNRIKYWIRETLKDIYDERKTK